MNCCGEERATLYCGDCGKRLRFSPIEGLLSHTMVISRQKRALFDRMNATKNPRLLERPRATLAKWESWHDALKTLIEESGGKEEKA